MSALDGDLSPSGPRIRTSSAGGSPAIRPRPCQCVPASRQVVHSRYSVHAMSRVQPFGLSRLTAIMSLSLVREIQPCHSRGPPVLRPHPVDAPHPLPGPHVELGRVLRRDPARVLDHEAVHVHDPQAAVRAGQRLHRAEPVVGRGQELARLLVGRRGRPANVQPFGVSFRRCTKVDRLAGEGVAAVVRRRAGRRGRCPGRRRPSPCSAGRRAVNR